jgi:hypothetical protein
MVGATSCFTWRQMRASEARVPGRGFAQGETLGDRGDDARRRTNGGLHLGGWRGRTSYQGAVACEPEAAADGPRPHSRSLGKAATLECEGIWVGDHLGEGGPATQNRPR